MTVIVAKTSTNVPTLKKVSELHGKIVPLLLIVPISDLVTIVPVFQDTLAMATTVPILTNVFCLTRALPPYRHVKTQLVHTNVSAQQEWLTPL